MTDQQFQLLINAIGKSISISDWLTLGVSIASLVVALAAMLFSRQQKNVSIRKEKYEIYTEILEILYFLKTYDGEITDNSEAYFKKLISLKAITGKAFSKNAETFIQDLLTKMHDIPVRKNAYESELPEDHRKVLENFGVDPNVHDALAVEYTNIRSFFNKGAFEKFETLFEL